MTITAKPAGFSRDFRSFDIWVGGDFFGNFIAETARDAIECAEEELVELDLRGF